MPYGTYELRVEAPNGYLVPEAVQLAINDKPNEAIDFSLDAIEMSVYLSTARQSVVVMGDQKTGEQGDWGNILIAVSGLLSPWLVIR